MTHKFNINKAILFLIFLFVAAKTEASKIEKGYEALHNNDYFKAIKIFSELNKKKPDPYSAFGLATIFSRNDNPFFNSDSAAKYVCQAFHLFISMEKPIKVKGVVLDSALILRMVDSIADRQLQRLKKENSVAKYNQFLLANYLASKNIIIECVYLRDEIEFGAAQVFNKSDSTRKFILTHPQSNFFIEAMLLNERQIYDETTKDRKAESYKFFLKKYPKSNLRNLAYDKLFEIYRQNSDVEGLKSFVSNYPDAPQNLEAWKLLFSLFVRSYTNSELKKFLEDYPAFPLKNSILKEVELNNIALFPYQRKDLIGFVNSEGTLVISPMFDAVTDFHEGLSVVNKNDSVYFINKENTNVFARVFSEAFTFKNGIAPVKLNNKWFFINRLGQQISKFYDEISELSNSVYIVKVNDRYGALDNYAQPLIEPRFSKLGDFKNEYAYYMEGSYYGFVSKNGAQHKAEFEWISDFNNRQVAVIKKNGSYGLINSQGKLILEPAYELIIKTNTEVFIVVQNGYYGFFSSDGCFLSQVIYEYAKDKPAEFYTNGDYFKLIKKSQQSLTGRNGQTLISFETYNEINFFVEGLMRVSKEVKKEIKYGYLDKHLNMVIPLKYQQAADFADSIAIVKSKEKFVMIDISGTELLISEYPITKLTAHYYLMDDGFKQLINQKGIIVFADIIAAQVINPWLLIVTLGNGEIKLLYD